MSKISDALVSANAPRMSARRPTPNMTSIPAEFRMSARAVRDLEATNNLANDNIQNVDDRLSDLPPSRRNKAMKNKKRFVANVPPTAAAYAKPVKPDLFRLGRSQMKMWAYVQLLPILQELAKRSAELEVYRRKSRANATLPEDQYRSRPATSRIVVEFDDYPLDVILIDMPRP